MARSARLVALLVTAVSAASACDAVAASGTDAPVRSSEMPFPDVTQTEPELAADGDRAVATYTDSGGGTTDLRGLSWSADGGRTWTQLPPGTLGGAGNEFGSGDVAWDAKEGKFFLTSLSSGCGT